MEVSPSVAQRAAMMAEFRVIQHDVERVERELPVDAHAHTHVLERLSRFRLKLRLLPTDQGMSRRPHEEPS